MSSNDDITRRNFVGLTVAGLAAAVAFNAQDPTNTSNFSTSITVYDSLGTSHSLDVYFVKTGDNTWDYHALANGDELNPVVAGQNVEVGLGTLSFTTDGALNTLTTTTAISLNFGGGATQAQAVTLDFGTPIWSSDNQTVFWSTGQGTRTTLFGVDVSTGELSTTKAPMTGVSGSFELSHDNQTWVFSYSNGTQSSDLWAAARRTA